MSDTASLEPRRTPRPEASQDERSDALSPEARAALDAGLESAKRGEIKPWGDFTKYATDDED
ncbi:MAG: hypothetical protein ABI548_16195 [Polyangiaceae bacterium]